MSYPQTQKVDKVDEYFGVRVADPFQWLEEDVRVSQDVSAWVESQNKLTSAYIAKLPYREAIEKRLTELWDYEKFGPPRKRGGTVLLFEERWAAKSECRLPDGFIGRRTDRSD